MHLKITSSPHLSSKINTSYIMLQVMVGLLPATVWAVYLFGQRAIFLIVNCILSAVISEVLILWLRKKPIVIGDCSAILSGLLLALILPPSTKWYAASLGSIFAILVGKHIFGGLGSNIFNPALIGRAFLMAAYPKMLTTFIAPNSINALTAATPLALRKFSQAITLNKDLFFGNVAGSLGETSSLLLIIGGLYILVVRIADWRIPLSLLLTTAVISIIGFRFNPLNGDIFFHLLSGGLLMGAFFMATDPVTTPITKKGRYIFGVGCGIFIMLIRYFSGLPEGVMYSILFMNAFTPLINRYSAPKPFGG
ncbi:MAG: RnfABCDGE type electron transport complex subunit D [Omnitrophica bacterium]|nr:RnfABCDGE type electron transport complex subunit D [Candidatus Omnitrophota bacterium]